MQQKCTYNLRGTSCESCEIVIEREARALKGVKSAQASHKKQQLILEVDPLVDKNKLEENLRDSLTSHGYSFSASEISTDQIKSARDWKNIGGALVLLFAVYLVFKQFGLFTFSPDVELGEGLFAIFLIGLVASVSSCTAVVIGLLTAISSASAQQNTESSVSQRFRPHALFNLGRIVGFAFFGAIVGMVGSVLQFSPALNGVFVLVIAIVMVSLGLHLLGLAPKTLHLSPPKWFAHKIYDLQNSKKPFVPFVLGALTFFLPCGFTQSMQLYALSLGDPIRGAIVMTIFALGTAPALLSVGYITSKTKGITLSHISRVAGAIVIVLGVSNFQNGATLLGWTSHPEISIASSPVSQVVLKDGRQLVQMEITSDFTYEPSMITVVEDVPVDWEIYGSNSMGCASSLVQRDFGVQASLRPGLNTVRFTPTKTGKFVFSCSMGMIRGTLIVVPKS
ncbi:sulfite exporter TauE/SafE family protein [Candidatus Uhrbacteria bacterium]|nr:sulfite exporter TauE/SafE family protein [Candidatus Uhrbacteria bacterium]